jgi:hypothetical protein
MDKPANLIEVYDELHDAIFRVRSIVYACQRTADEQGSDLSGALHSAFATLHDVSVLLQDNAQLFGAEPGEPTP